MKILVALPLDERQKRRLEQNFRHQEFRYCLPEELSAEILSDAEVILGNVPPQCLGHARKLRWLQLNNAGTEGYCDGALPEDVILTNATGAYGLAISEHMRGMLFELQKKLNLYSRNQREHLWQREGHVRIIEGSRVLVIGLGDIGTAFARKMKALGCRTTGIKRREGRREPCFAVRFSRKAASSAPAIWPSFWASPCLQSSIHTPAAAISVISWSASFTRESAWRRAPGC